MLTNTSRSSRSRDSGGGDRRLQIGSGHAHAEVHALAAFQGTRDVPRAGKVADDDLGADRPQRFGSFIFASDERMDGKTASTKDLNDLSANSADASRGARDENRSVD